MENEPTEPIVDDSNIDPSQNVAPAPEPVVVAAPVAPVAAPAPVPSTQGWPDQTPQPAQIQYVMAQKSLEGIGGMLVFWLIAFGLTGAGYFSIFFMSAFNPAINSTGAGIVTIIFAPLIAVAALGTVVLIALRKKRAVLASLVSVGVMTLYSIVNTIVVAAAASAVVNTASDIYSSYSYDVTPYAQSAQSTLMGVAIGTIVATLVYGGLVALYFLTSKRVKQTLIK